MTTPDTQGETHAGNHAEKRMKRSERAARFLGGYALGFTGVGMQAHGILSLNPFSFAAGTGLTYLSHRVMDPYNNYRFGTPTHERSKLSRFVRFNAGLVPTYVGAALVTSALVGPTAYGAAHMFRQAGRGAAERTLEGVIGVPVLFAGHMVEQHMHSGEPIVNIEHPPVIEAHLHGEEPQGRMARLYSHVKDAWHALRGQPIPQRPPAAPAH